MKKSIVLGAIPLILVAIVVFGVIPAPAQAQTITCPAGYVCTPINPTPTSPATPGSDATVTVVGSPTLKLTYDPAQQESLLTSTFQVSVYGGTQGVNIYKTGGGATFIDQKGTTYSANSLSPAALTPLSPSITGTDNYSQTFFIVPPGESVNFQAVVTVNPKQLFAGTYHSSLISIWANPSAIITSSFNLQAPSNQTNSVTIIGEVSPYITSVTNPATVGTPFSINGQRLNGGTINLDEVIYIDGQATKVVIISQAVDGSSLIFNLPDLLTGYHTIQVVNSTGPNTGASNKVSFQVQSASPCYTWTTNLSTGSTGPDVVALQTWLITNGYDIPPISSGAYAKGYFGTATAAALAQYQASVGIPEDGYFGPITRAKLNASCTTTQPSITVLSPNGGESLSKGSSYSIKWSQPQSAYVNIRLQEISPTCSDPVTNCNSPNYNIAINKSYPIGNNDYSWVIGNVLDTATLDGTVKTYVVPDGLYKIEVCYWAVDMKGCDSSDSYFKIYSGTTTAPTATITIGGQHSYTYNVGQYDGWVWSSTNADTFSSTYTANNPTQCGAGNWVANTRRGIVSTYLGPQWAGCIWTVTYTAKNSQTGQSASDSATLTVNGTTTPTTQPSITVLSPNGGETWNAGKVYSVRWTGNNQGKNIALNLIDYTPGPRYGMEYAVRDGTAVWGNNPQDSRNVTSGYDYFAWNVPASIPSGFYYKLYVGDATPNTPTSGNSDGSDSYFTITSGTLTNLPPVISSVTAPTYLNIGQQGTWTVNASDPENGPLSYSVDWGDMATCPAGYTCASNVAPKSFVQTSTFTHSYASAGTYKATFTVTDSAGLTAQSSATVQVGSVTAQPSITVQSPSGGEVFNQGQQVTIKYFSSNFPRSINIAVQLNKGAVYPNGPFNPVTTISSGYSPATGSYTFTIPTNLASGNDYSFLISSDYPSTETSGGNDGHSNNFTITTPSQPTQLCPTNATAPIINSFSPSSGSAGTTVTVKGCNFGDSDTLYWSIVMSNGYSGGFTLSMKKIDANTWTFAVPNYSYGTYSVYYDDDFKGGSNKMNFTITAPTTPTASTSVLNAAIWDAVRVYFGSLGQ